MSDTTICHFTQGNLTPVCGADDDNPVTSPEPGDVTCFRCRRVPAFVRVQAGDRIGTPIPQRQAPPPLTPPVKLSGIMAASEELAELAREARRRELEAQAAKEMVAAARNERGMYVIEEVIHHGDYRSVRRVEVYDINETTVDAVLQSSAYCYGSWKHPESISHREHRNTALSVLVEDLKWGRTNRAIGWSTFRTITTH